MTEKQEARYINDYMKCKGCKLAKCRIKWQEYPTLFRKGKVINIPDKYQHLNLPEKIYSSRCRRCAVGYSIDNYKDRQGDSKIGKSLEELREEFNLLNKESDEVQNAEIYKTDDTILDCDSICDKKRIQELEIKLNEVNQQLNESESDGESSDSLINQNMDLSHRVTELEDTLTSLYSIIYNTKERVPKRQRECRERVSIKVRNYYDIKHMIEKSLPEKDLPYQSILNEHHYSINPEDWESQC